MAQTLGTRLDELEAVCEADPRHLTSTGRAHRIRAPRKFTWNAKSLPGVWGAAREDIADRYLDHHEVHIPGQVG